MFTINEVKSALDVIVTKIDLGIRSPDLTNIVQLHMWIINVHMIIIIIKSHESILNKEIITTLFS